MMFDWTDQEQVGDTIWAEFGGNEDHIVPYPEGSQDNSKNNPNSSNNSNNNPNNNNNNNNNNYHKYGDQDQKNNEKNSENKSNFEDCDMDNNESWPDLPALNGLNTGDFNNGDEEDNMASEYLNDFEPDSDLDKVQVQLEGEHEPFANENKGENDDNNSSFLHCDWGNIGDFDDFDRLFSNGDSIFGNELEGTGEPFLSQCSDVINSTTPHSIPLPNLFGDASKQGSSSLQKDEISPGNIKTEENENNKRLQQKRKKPGGEKGKNKITVLPLDNSGHVPVMQHHASSLHHPAGYPFPGFGYPGYAFPGVPIPSKPVPGSCKIEKPVLMMTPQEKIEKLRRRQQMQALLAIQQQKQQLGHGNDNLVPQVSSPKNQNRDSSMSSSALLEGSSANKGLTSGTTMPEEFSKDDTFMEETIYYQLQDTLTKLEVRVRLCIRDSLLRLARSAMERQSIDNSTLSSSSARDDLVFSHSRCEETGTNRIDRTVAHLLFHKLSEKSASLFKEGAPFSPISFNSELEVSGARLEENRQNGNEMEVEMNEAV